LSHQFDDLSKKLASGVSRRSAVWGFAAGLAGVAGALLTGGKAKAQNNGNDDCVVSCKAQGFTGSDLGHCVAASAKCPAGTCAVVPADTKDGAFVCSVGNPT
jgi:hypothetical protein